MHYSLLRFFNYSFPFMYFYITKIWTFIYYIQVVFEFLHFVYLFRCYGHLFPIYSNAHIFLIIYFYFFTIDFSLNYSAFIILFNLNNYA